MILPGDNSSISGKTLVIPMIGHPVRQVHMPGVLNARFAGNGIDAVMVALDLAPPALPSFVHMMRLSANIPGCVVTLPHKAAVSALIDEVSGSATIIGAVNVIRRTADNRLEGDMLDGWGMAGALAANDVAIEGASCWVIGAGAAGTAIALALCDAGASLVWLSDTRPGRAEAVAARFALHGRSMLSAGRPPDPAALSILVNATPVGMDGRSSPLDAHGLAALAGHCCVADVITEPVDTPLLKAARQRGLRTIGGNAMAEMQTDEVARYMGFDFDR